MITTVDDLVTWLRAQLDEDERVARHLKGVSFRLADAATGEIVASNGEAAEVCAEAHWVGVGEHIARHDPARVLREVQSKRRILDGHPFEQGIVGGVCGTCHGAGRIEVLWDGDEETVEHVDTEMPWPCPTVRLLALPYADRPGYREEWRP